MYVSAGARGTCDARVDARRSSVILDKAKGDHLSVNMLARKPGQSAIT